MANGSDPISGGVSGAAAGSTLGPIGAAAGGVIGTIGGLIGSSGSKRAAREAEARRRAIIEGWVIPTADELKVILDEYRLAGIYEPRLEAMAEQLGPSAMSDIEIDPRLREAQLSALDKLSETGAQGLTEGDLAELRMMSRDVDAAAQAQQQALQQEMAMRGQATSGQELALRAQAGQASANRRADEYDRRVMEAQRRALDAMERAGQLGGSIRSQDFGEAARIAEAADMIDRLNLEQRAGVKRRDIDRMNVGQQANLSARQNILDKNVGVQHQQAFSDREALIDAVEYDKEKRAMLAGQAARESAAASERAKNISQNLFNIGQGLGKTWDAFRGYTGPEKKKD